MEKKVIVGEMSKQLRLAGPLILANVLQFSLQVISIMFVGCFGVLALSGASMATSFTSVTGLSVLVWVLLYAVSFFLLFFCLILDIGILLVYLHLGLVVFYSLHCFWGFIPTLFLQETDPMSFIILSQTAHLSLDISCHHLCQKNQLKGIFLVYYYLFFHFATSFLLLCSSNNINGYIRTLVSTQTCHVTHHSILSS